MSTISWYNCISLIISSVNSLSHLTNCLSLVTSPDSGVSHSWSIEVFFVWGTSGWTSGSDIASWRIFPSSSIRKLKILVALTFELSVFYCTVIRTWSSSAHDCASTSATAMNSLWKSSLIGELCFSALKFHGTSPWDSTIDVRSSNSSSVGVWHLK